MQIGTNLYQIKTVSNKYVMKMYNVKSGMKKYSK